MNGRNMKSSVKGTKPLESSSPLPGDVVRAVAWLREHPSEPVALDQLAATAGVRPRTLEAHFRQFLGTTPRALARRMRLANARRQLLSADSAADVTRIALASGFNQPGRFAGEYRGAFGELPSQTLRRARSGCAGSDDGIDDEALRISWRAVPAAFTVAPDQCTAALEGTFAAQALAPSYALPKAIAAWCLRQRTAQGFRSANAEDGELSCRLAYEASALAPDDALVLTLAAGALTLAGQLDEADQMIERALAIDPWAPWGWLRRGWLSAYHGDPDLAIRDLKIALQLMPFEPIRHLILIGIAAAHFEAGRYERAASWARDGVEACPGSFWASRIVAAAATHAGARAEARRVVREIRRRDPDLTVTEAREAWPFPRDFMDRLGDGLATAGLPKG
jgi:AraC-like DNA-binding protein